MEIRFCIALASAVAVIIVLAVKIYFLKKSACEIADKFTDRLNTDTNTLIDISCNDRCMRKLANTVNIQLRQLRKQRLNLRQGNAELKNAVTNISHDLRTPLTSICGYLDLLENEEKSETVTRYLDIIANRTQVLKSLTEELFDYSVIISKESNIKTESTVINAVLQESVAAFYVTLKERGITPEISLPDKDVYAIVDRDALSRVFENLLNNAVKYTDGDLKITLSESGEITFCNKASTLNDVVVEKLFDRFFTVESAEKSTGLGLSIAKTLCERMDSNISAKYENGELSVVLRLKQ